MEEADVVKSLAALAQPVRLQVFRALVVAGPRGMTPSTMASCTTCKVSTKAVARAGASCAQASSAANSPVKPDVTRKRPRCGPVQARTRMPESLRPPVTAFPA